LASLAPCLCRWALPLGAVMPQISLALASHVCLGDQDQRRRAYDFALEDCLMIAVSKAAQAGETIGVVLSRNTEYNDRAATLFEEFRKKRAGGSVLQSFDGRGSPQELLPLQAADLVAWAIVRPTDHPEDGAPEWRNEAQRTFLECR